MGSELLGLPLILLVFTAILSLTILVGLVPSFGTGSSNPFIGGGVLNGSLDAGVYGNQSVNGTGSLYQSEAIAGPISFSISSTIIEIIVMSVAFTGVLGIRIAWSGLAEFSVMAVSKWAALYLLWLSFSIPALQLFNAVPLFGGLIYFLLTFVFCLGVLQSMQMGGS